MHQLCLLKSDTCGSLLTLLNLLEFCRDAITLLFTIFDSFCRLTSYTLALLHVIVSHVAQILRLVFD